MTNLEACLKKFWYAAWRMGDDILAVNGQAIKCWVQQNVGSCVMWSPRVYPFIHCKGSTEETRRIMAFTTPHRNTELLVWYPAWQVPLGLHRILNLSMIKDRRWSYHTTRILRVHLPQLLGWEQNVDVPIPPCVDTLAWTSTVLPQTGVETTDLVLRKRQAEVIRSSHLISHTYVKVRDEGGDKIWAGGFGWCWYVSSNLQSSDGGRCKNSGGCLRVVWMYPIDREMCVDGPSIENRVCGKCNEPVCR